jgi:hypothetical protein
MRRPVDILCKRLDEASKNGETLNMKYMYAAVTLDIINDYCFARDPENVLKADFGRKGFDDVDSFLEVSLLVGESRSKPTLDHLLTRTEYSHPLAHAHQLLSAGKPWVRICTG